MQIPECHPMKTYQLIPVVLLTLVLNAHAQVTVIGRWRLGENDPGATASAATIGATVNLAQATYSLTKEGTVFYSADTPSSSLTPLGQSTLSMSFTGAGTYNGYYRAISGWGGDLPAHTTNVAVEAWIKPANLTLDDRVILTLGRDNSGFAILQNGSDLEVRYGTSMVARIVSSGLSLTEWTHVAFVRGTTTGTLYVNGTAVGYTTATIPAFDAITTYFGVGEQPSAPGGQNFVGLIDEVRYFTFTEGSFNTSMLNYAAVPEPSTYAAVGGLAALLLAGWRRRHA